MVRTTTGLIGAMALAAGASASISHYDDLAEGFYGESFTHNGVTYRNVNDVAGVFPDGSTFDADGINGLGNTVIVENAGLLYNDFPEWGSATNALTFGSSYVTGSNLSIGALSTVWMDLAEPASSASVETVFYENGPWSGIVFHFEALLNGQVVASDSYALASGGDRDTIGFRTFAVSAPQFDQLHMYATFGLEYSGPRMMLDNLTLTPVPAPGAAGLVAVAGLAALRRRRG